MNTKTTQLQKKSRQHKAQQEKGQKGQQRGKRQGRTPVMLHEQELPETRMFR